MRWKKKVRPKHGTAVLRTFRPFLPVVCLAPDGTREYVVFEKITELRIYGYAGWETVERFSTLDVTNPSVVSLIEKELTQSREFRYYDLELKDSRFIQRIDDDEIKLTPLVAHV